MFKTLNNFFYLFFNCLYSLFESFFKVETLVSLRIIKNLERNEWHFCSRFIYFYITFSFLCTCYFYFSYLAHFLFHFMYFSLINAKNHHISNYYDYLFLFLVFFFLLLLFFFSVVPIHKQFRSGVILRWQCLYGEEQEKFRKLTRSSSFLHKYYKPLHTAKQIYNGSGTAVIYVVYSFILVFLSFNNMAYSVYQWGRPVESWVVYKWVKFDLKIFYRWEGKMFLNFVKHLNPD